MTFNETNKTYCTECGTLLNPEFGDRRDRAVLDALEPGDIVTAREIRHLYEARTDIRDRSKLKRRTRQLTEHAPFEWVDCGCWRFTLDEQLSDEDAGGEP